jgi:hypothetical protein
MKKSNLYTLKHSVKLGKNCTSGELCTRLGLATELAVLEKLRSRNNLAKLCKKKVGTIRPDIQTNTKSFLEVKSAMFRNGISIKLDQHEKMKVQRYLIDYVFVIHPTGTFDNVRTKDFVKTCLAHSEFMFFSLRTITKVLNELQGTKKVKSSWRKEQHFKIPIKRFKESVFWKEGVAL